MLEISPYDQGITALLALALGAALGFVYELLAIPRRRVGSGVLTAAVDLFFCLAAFFSFAWFTMARTHGALRVDAGLLCLLGFGLYRAFPARILTPFLGKIFLFLFKLPGLLLLPMWNFMKKCKKSFSSPFQKRKDWCIINRK